MCNMSNERLQELLPAEAEEKDDGITTLYHNLVTFVPYLE